MFVYKHAKQYNMLKISRLFMKIQALWVNNSRILTSKNAKFSGYSFDMNLNIWGDFHICISLPLRRKFFEKSNHRASHDVLPVNNDDGNMLTIVGFNKSFKKSFFSKYY